VTWTFGQQIWNGLVTGVAYSIFAMGLTMIFGMMRVINMAHGEFYMLGAMLLYSFTVWLGIPFFVALFLSAVSVGLIGVAFNGIAVRPLLSQQPLAIMMSSMAVSVIGINLATTFWNTDTRVIPTPMHGEIHVAGLILSNATIALSLIGIASLIGLHLFLTQTVLGAVMRATAQDRVGAALVGINVKRVYAFTVAIAAMLAALAGGIIGPIWSASPSMGQDILLKGFAVVVVGGMGNARGCVITGLLLGVSEALFGQYISMFYRDVYAFAILIVVCLVRPQGLFANA
jgi:branched-chain amino acid transport system permease protein